jgi:hypothetical protein
LRGAIAASTATVVEHLDRITGYATGISFSPTRSAKPIRISKHRVRPMRRFCALGSTVMGLMPATGERR